MFILHSKRLSNSKVLYFSVQVEFEKSFARFLINRTLKVIGSVFKVEKEEKYFMKYFFRINVF